MIKNTRIIGQTGLSSSILGFGCMRLPITGKTNDSVDVDLSVSMIRQAVDRGVTYVDSAYPYHSNSRTEPGMSEPILGQALRGGYREKVTLATKLPTWLVEKRSDMDKFLDLQLSRLGVSQIDFYLAHNLNSSVWDKLLSLGLRQFMDEAVKDGRIHFPGFSFHDFYPIFEKIVSSYDWAFAQIQYNYLDTEYQAGKKGLELAASKGMGLVIMEPLRGGFLVNSMPPEPREILTEARPDWSLPAWALNFIWNHPQVSVVLSGMSTPEQVDENILLAEQWHEGLFTARDDAALTKVKEYFAANIKANCTSCGYCMPCPSGVDIPKNLTFLNQYYLFDTEAAKSACRYYYSIQLTEEQRSSNCVGCKECEEKCPQSLTIPEFLAQTAQCYKSE
ncbi:MAG: aldo/keto reductase [Deltaproteobacteria bacterium]|jgi:predicted aldo/keto reductase-like oxidoreductase|nr:aldo/keto reductase [Deltaproteobacteria bacterium]